MHPVSSYLISRAAPEQGGLLSGKDPTAVDTIPTDPIRLWIIQMGIIVTTASVLSLGLQRIRQPKVIAEVLGGILLGHTAFGRIPGFTKHIFPDESKSNLNLTANIGLCLFLFLVGLEIDASVIKRNARLSVAVAVSGMVLPFGLGCALAVPLYAEFIDPSIKFTYFMLFSGVAFSITAFPVLCRILTELKLLDTTVGIVVLSAGVGNDIIGWTLLALSVALVNAGSGLTALYILLVCVGWTLVIFFPVKYALKWLGRKTGSIESGVPTMTFMTIVIICVFASSFFTDVIGVHAIFGAFLLGLVVPREGGLAIALTEKLEDVVGIVFLPLYFTLSGLSTDLGLLNDGKTWGYTIAIISLAFTGKFGACTLGARYGAGFSWREGATIGSLMSCKGLVELIVLNVGLSAGILTPKVFSMFVLEALVLTFMTTPLVTTLYPPAMRIRVSKTGANFNNVPEKDLESDKRMEGSAENMSGELGQARRWTNFTVVLDKMEHLPGMMAFTQLVKPQSSPSLKRASAASSSSSSKSPLTSPTTFHPLRILPLSDRLLSPMLRSSPSAFFNDQVLMVFRMFTTLNRLFVREPQVEVASYDEKAGIVVDFSLHGGRDKGMIAMSWLPPSEPEAEEIVATPRSTGAYNPFDALFGTRQNQHNSSNNEENSGVDLMHAYFVRSVFGKAGKGESVVDVGLFIDLGLGSSYGVGDGGEDETIYLPFFGGPDDRLALDFVAQLGRKAVVVRVTKADEEEPFNKNQLTHTSAFTPAQTLSGAHVTQFPDTIYASQTPETRLQSDTADSIAFARHENNERMEIREMRSSSPLKSLVEDVRTLRGGRRVIVVTGRSRRLAAENHTKELKGILQEHFMSHSQDIRKTVGDVATAFMAMNGADGVVVVQSGRTGI